MEMNNEFVKETDIEIIREFVICWIVQIYSDAGVISFPIAQPWHEDEDENIGIELPDDKSVKQTKIVSAQTGTYIVYAQWPTDEKKICFEYSRLGVELPGKTYKPDWHEEAKEAKQRWLKLNAKSSE